MRSRHGGAGGLSSAVVTEPSGHEGQGRECDPGRGVLGVSAPLAVGYGGCEGRTARPRSGSWRRACIGPCPPWHWHGALPRPPWRAVNGSSPVIEVQPLVGSGTAMLCPISDGLKIIAWLERCSLRMIS